MKNRLISKDEERELSERLYTHVDRIAGLIGPRHLGKPNSMEVTATYIARALVEFGFSVDRQTYEAENTQVANRVVERPGARRADEVVILGAHYDTVPTTPGANDCTEPNSQQIPPGVPRWLHWAFPGQDEGLLITHDFYREQP